MLLKENLAGFQHLGVPVTDISAAEKSYASTLGFQLTSQHVIPTEEGDVKVAFLELNGLVLECYQLVGVANDQIKTRGNGHIDHFAIEVVDIERALGEALAAGATKDPTVPHGLVLSSRVMKSVFLRAPTGERMELTQRMDMGPGRYKGVQGKLSHLGIAATDIKMSIAFYARLGFHEVVGTIHRAERDGILVAFLERGGFCIELFQPAGRALEDLRNREDGRIDHVALHVVDVDSAYAELRAAGFKPLENAPVTLNLGPMSSRYFNVRGPDGEKLELAQPLT
jgi:lactoylglutathione lyase